MISFWNAHLTEIDKVIASVSPGEIPALFEQIPLDVFALLQLEDQIPYENIAEFFPTMPSRDIQTTWVGAEGLTLLLQSLSFVHRIVARYTAATGKELAETKVLDYGCGWGRLMRIMYKYVPHNRIYGVDPNYASIELCHSHNVRGNLAIIDYVPTSLPFVEKFDLIYAFSVFTHLSEKTALRVLSIMRKYIADDGLLFITIRPREYWNFHEGGNHPAADEKIVEHDSRGFAFIPHILEPIDGDITYGDTSFSLDWLRNAQNDWIVDSTEYSTSDHLQIIVALKSA